MLRVECRTQAELDAALAAGNYPVLVGDGRFAVWGSATVRASGSATVRAWGSATVRACDSATVRAWGSATVRASGSATVRASGSATVEACDSATVEASGSATVRASGSATVEACDSATVEASGSATVRASGSATVRAWDSATVRASGSATVEASGSATVRASGSATVRAWDSATVRAWDSATVRASGNVIVRALGRAVIAASVAVVVVCHGCDVQITGGIKIVAKEPSTPAEWCEHHGVEVIDGVAILYKGVYDSCRSDHGFDYTTGTTPIAPDWDEGKKECGGGLHFSPCQLMTREFCSAATKFVACPVALADMRAPKSGDDYPQKIKARGCCAPVYEVTIDGERVAAVESVGAQ